MNNKIDTIWKPHVTVAAVIERDGKFLMVEEVADTVHGRAFNQPAGHLEPDEDLVSAMVRETLEETAWEVEPVSLIGVYRWPNLATDTTYLRFAFSARAIRHHDDRPLDTGIIAAHWLTIDDITRNRPLHRGPQVMQCISDYRSNEALPLSILKELDAS